MIDSWNAAKLNERITQVEKKIQANDVIANPTGAATADLSKISIDGTVYGTSVVKVNPTGEATGTLSKVSIDGSVYSISDATSDTSVSGIEVRKTFGIVILSLDGTALTFDEDGKTLTAIVPEGFRPSKTTLEHAEIYNGTTYIPCLVSVYNTGIITIANFGGGVIASANLEYLKSPNIVY